MFQYEEEESHVCYNCDAEFTVAKQNGDTEEEISFCPFCGYDMEEEEFDEEDEDDPL